MVPYAPVMFHIVWNDPKFYLWQEKTNAKNYSLQIVDAALHVDVCGISNPGLRHFDAKFITDKKPVIYHFNGKLLQQIIYIIKNLWFFLFQKL